MAAVLRALEEGRRLVTVTGPGGVGKSRLLADVGAALAPGREVVHVALSGHQAGDAQDLAAALAVATGVPLAGDDHVAAVVRALRASDVTVLVDEAEWVLEPAAALAGAILAGCPRVRLVVTSRVPLSVVGERVLPLSPLPVADAVRLLTERLGDRGLAPATWTAQERRVLAEVARRVDRLRSRSSSWPAAPPPSRWATCWTSSSGRSTSSRTRSVAMSVSSPCAGPSPGVSPGSIRRPRAPCSGSRCSPALLPAGGARGHRPRRGPHREGRR